MILATVGTHEDPFDRLLLELERLVESGEVQEEVWVQAGTTKVATPRLRAEAMLPFDALQDAMRRARIVITHGGPASIMQALAHGKVPVVVPRQAAFGEHVDDHQVRFAERIADRVLVVVDIRELGPVLRDYDRRVAGLRGGDYGPERARAFSARLEALCTDLVGRRDSIRRR